MVCKRKGGNSNAKEPLKRPDKRARSQQAGTHSLPLEARKLFSGELGSHVAVDAYGMKSRQKGSLQGAIWARVRCETNTSSSVFRGFKLRFQQSVRHHRLPQKRTKADACRASSAELGRLCRGSTGRLWRRASWHHRDNPGAEHNRSGCERCDAG